MHYQPSWRAGWIRNSLLVSLVACGGVLGLYLSGIWSAGAPTERQVAAKQPVAAFEHRFPLTERDAKDTIEAPELAADASGRIYLTWASKTGATERTVFLSRSLDGGRTFDAATPISKGGVFRSMSKGKREGFERRATPHVAVSGKEVHLAWSEAEAGGARMRMLLATSTDGGQTFGPGRVVHQAVDANPTFTALAQGPRGEFACAWLGSPAGQQPFASLRRRGASEFAIEKLVHPGEDGKGVCPCCALAACFADDGTLYVAFRNLADGYRDIAVGVMKPGRTEFEGPFPMTPPTWKFNGCPHDGPSLAVVGERLHVVWMDAHTGSQRCYHASAKRADMAFTSAELHAMPVGTQGNAKLHVDAAGRLHAVWEESATAAEASDKHQHGAPAIGAGGRAIYHGVLGADGRFAAPQAVAARTGAYQTRPAIAVMPSGLVAVAWNELDETGKAVVVKTFEAEARR